MSNVTIKSGAVCEISINRPEKRNALDRDTLIELQSSISSSSSDDACKAIIITGAGGKAFSAGADIKYMSSITSMDYAEEMFELFLGVTNAITKSGKVIVAAIDGYCFGGGCEIAAACDFRFASENSKFAQPEVKLGIIPGGGATYRLEHIIGLQNARRMILTGETISSEEAKSIGLIDEITSSTAIEYARNFLKNIIDSSNPKALAYAKSAINYGLNYDYSMEKRLFAESLMGEEAKSLMLKFLNKK
ncbi:enoyl-CoA hydratase/isomerase family protein [Candidatus Marsarchaeota archaeon]|nr:enoyl-CoA hydratase/isomerase family protein [Candidatus Marsarchaeota archaeon]